MPPDVPPCRSPWLRIGLLLLSIVALLSPSFAQPPAPASPPAAVPASRQARNVAIITIRGEIRPGVTAESFKRRLKEAEVSGADAVVIELDTPGGEVGAVLEICNAIKGSPIPNTVGWVHPTAYSGGALIALACREMVASDPATMGDALPIAVTFGMLNRLPEHERQKILSPLMAEVVDSARRNGYDEYLVQGIVSRGVELWWVEDAQTGRRLAIDRAEYRTIFGSEPPVGRPRLVSAQGDSQPIVIPPGPSPDSPSGTPPPAPGPDTPPAAPLLPPMDDDTAYRPAAPGLEAIAKEVSDAQSVSSDRPIFTEGDRGRYTLIEQVSDGAGPVVMKHDDMERYGFTRATINSDEELRAYFGATTVRRLEASWSERLAFWMTNPLVRGVLIAVFLVALFIELTHPGVALPGAIAVLALVGLVGPPLMVGMANWWEIAAILAGIVLVMLEILVLPGFTVFGALGLILVFGGLIGTFVREEPGQLFPDSPGSRNDLLYGLATILLSTLSASVTIYFVAKNFGSLPLISKLVLRDTSGDEPMDPLIAAMDPTDGVGVAPGEKGRTITPLRPAGRAMISGRVIDVVADLGFLDANTPVRVVEATPFRITVERDPDPTGPTEEQNA